MLEIQPECRRDLFLPHNVWGLNWKDSKSFQMSLSWVTSLGVSLVIAGQWLEVVAFQRLCHARICRLMLGVLGSQLGLLEHLDLVSSCGLRFLTVWQLQSTGTSYTVAPVSRDECPKTTRRELCALCYSSFGDYSIPLLPRSLGGVGVMMVGPEPRTA